MSIPAILNFILAMKTSDWVFVAFCVSELSVVMLMVGAFSYDAGMRAERKVWLEKDAEERRAVMLERFTGRRRKF
jgi:hypothetical protein